MACAAIKKNLAQPHIQKELVACLRYDFLVSMSTRVVVRSQKTPCPGYEGGKHQAQARWFPYSGLLYDSAPFNHRHVVQVYTPDETKLFATILAIARERERTWFYP
jgi:hypothetical protein